MSARHHTATRSVVRSVWRNVESRDSRFLRTLTSLCSKTLADWTFRGVRSHRASLGLPIPLCEILENVFAAAGLEISGLEPLDWLPEELTVSGHGNGGFYIIPGAALATVAHTWARWAKWLMDNVAVLEDFPRHIDQPSMALALSDLGIAPYRLDIRWNFPAHNPPRIPSNANRPAVVHYHRGVGAGGLLNHTGVAAVDDQIDSANRAIKQVWLEAFPNASVSDGCADFGPESASTVDHRGVVEDKRTFRGRRACSATKDA